MNRREMEAIANVIRNRREIAMRTPAPTIEMRTLVVSAVESVARDLAIQFKTESPGFRNDLFFAACGMRDH